MDLLASCIYLFFFIILVLIVALLVIYFTSMPPNLHRFESEKFFIDPKQKDQKVKLPSISDAGTIDLSVIIPAYNEEARLPVMMEETMAYLEARQQSQKGFTYEVIIVDDGSKDKTSQVAIRYTYDYGADKVRLLRLRINRGKGGAVRMGMLSSRGKLLLFADADGATKFRDLEKLESSLNSVKDAEGNMAVICGSRAHLEKDSIARRSLFRTFLMHGFHFLVWFLCVKSIRDTQCGFKLLTRDAAHLIFMNLHVDRWAFDADMLYIAEHFHIPIAEVAVNWTEIDGSKLTPVFSWLEMGRDLLMIRLRYMTGGWDLQPLSKLH